jgi:hypothetical protein
MFHATTEGGGEKNLSDYTSYSTKVRKCPFQKLFFLKKGLQYAGVKTIQNFQADLISVVVFRKKAREKVTPKKIVGAFFLKFSSDLKSFQDSGHLDTYIDLY